MMMVHPADLIKVKFAGPSIYCRRKHHINNSFISIEIIVFAWAVIFLIAEVLVGPLIC